MKKVIKLLFLLLLSWPTLGQRYTPVLSGTTAAAVIRDLVTYPASSSGTAALVANIIAGNVPLTVRPPDAAIVGKFSYLFSDTRRDYLNHAVVSEPAPVLFDAARTAPRLLGNYYEFAPQTALNTALFKRIPSFSPHASKILIYPGGLYSGSGDNDLVGRGWTHTSESAKWPGSVYPTSYRRAIEMANYAAAYQAAQDLADGHPSKQKLLDWAGPLPAFEGNHLFIDDENTCKLYAAKWWNTLKQNDWVGAGVDYFSVNHEVFVAREGTGYDYVAQWYRQIGWITKEIIRLASLEGITLKSGMTDWGNLTHPAPYFFDDTDPATGFPRYMSVGYVVEPYRGSSQSAPLGATTDIGALVRDGKAFVGVGSYVQHTFDDQSLFEKNTNGTYKIGPDGGLIWRTDKRTVSITGQSTVLYKEDAYKSQLKFYALFARFATNQYFRAGGVHLPRSDVRQSGFSSVRLSSQFRLDTEVESGLTPSGTGLSDAEFGTLNSRPLNPDWTEGHAMAMYLFSDYIRGWMETQNQTTLGADNGKSSKARASVEIYAKGFQRAAQLNWIHDTPWTLVQPKLWIKNQGIVSSPSADEQFYRKPIIMGGIATKDGHPTMWLYAWWPSQDTDRYTDVIVWANKGTGAVTPGYRVRLKGRKAFLDYWRLPDGATDLTPKDIYFQFSSLLGERITWRGDYREAKITVHPVPPLVQENGLNLSSTGPVSSTAVVASLAIKSGYSWYSGSQNYTIYANRTDTELYRAKLTALDGQTNPAPSLADMEVGSFTDPSGRGWNLRRVLYPVAPGRWSQTVVRQSTGAQATASVALASGVSSDAVLTTVSSATSTASTIGLAARYSYSTSNSGTIQIRGLGTGSYTLKIERQDGQSMTMSNADNPVLNSGVFYPFGTVVSDYPMDWTFYNVPAVPIVLTFNLSGATNSVTFTPTIGANQQILTTSTTGTGGGSGSTTGPSSTAYFSNGFGEGSVSQLMQSAPFVPAVNQYAGWPAGNTEQFINDGTVKLGISKMGGIVTHISYQGGANWINTNADGSSGTYEGTGGWPDPGRSGPGWSMYGNPGTNYQENGGSTSEYFDTGFNPVQAGSVYKNYSPVTWFERRTVPGYGEVLYSRTTPYQWALHGVLSKTTVHTYHWIDAQHLIRYFTIIENNRDDNQRTYQFRQQEAPYIYPIANFYHHYVYTGTAPGTGGALTAINPVAPLECACPDNLKYGPQTTASEGYVAAVDDAGNALVLIPQHNSNFGTFQALSRSGDATSNATSYINSAMFMNYDENSTSAFSGYVYAGTLTGFRSWFNSTTIPRPAFSFSFGTRQMAGWWPKNSEAKYNSDNRYQFRFRTIDGTGFGGEFWSPVNLYKAADIPVLYIKGKFANVNQILIRWYKAGQSEAAAISANQAKLWNVTGDGVERTVVIPMAGIEGWDGTLSSVRISLPEDATASYSQTFVPTYIGNINPN